MPNRLARETSPYLQQHADNPVDWYPWGDEAFARARETGRPILLSVGYAACHWCHVMERESFSDDETARVMNERFINVKVDREERPDVDSIYMTAVQRMTGQGGWPMTVFLTPEGVPFYGGTYFPPEPRHGLPSFRQVLEGIGRAYTDRPEDVQRSADELRRTLEAATGFEPPVSALDDTVLDAAAEQILARFDGRNGGFGGAPKFPQPMVLEFLLRHWRRTGQEAPLRAVEHTLERMWRGGIFDHLAGGFHRYSVDARWLVPHFEKMLYDNALLAEAYVSAYRATGRPLYREIAERTLDFVLRDMRASDGGFISSLDADTEGEEGKYYVWDAAEFTRVVGDDAPAAAAVFGVTEAGNFEGKNILHRPRADLEVAADLGVDPGELETAIARATAKLLAHRGTRIHPARDEKVLTAWNAMAVRALAEAGAAFDRPEYVAAAGDTAEFILRELASGDGLLRSYRAGEARVPGFLDDHALMVDALISLYEAAYEPRWIDAARELARVILAHFRDEGTSHFYDTADDAGGELFVRARDYYDNATPSGGSAAATALLRLSALTGDAHQLDAAESTLRSFASLLREVPQGFGALASAAAAYLAPIKEVAIVGPADASETKAMIRVMRERYLPDAVTAFRDPEHAPSPGPIPLLDGREPIDGGPAAYVCQRFTCRRPVTTAAALADELSPRGND